MNTVSLDAAKTLGALLAELLPEHKATARPLKSPSAQSAQSRGLEIPDVAMEIFARVGLSDVTAPALPQQDPWSPARTMFETWFEDAATRDRWRVDDVEDAIPWDAIGSQSFPVHVQGEAVVFADLAGNPGDPPLFRVERAAPTRVELALSYGAWLARRWVERLVRRRNAPFFFGHDFAAKAILAPLSTEFTEVGPRVWCYVEKAPNKIGGSIVFDTIPDHVAWVRSLPAEALPRFRAPSEAHRFLIKGSKRSPNLDPRNPVRVGDLAVFAAVHHNGNPVLARGHYAVGTLEERSIWIRSDLQPGEAIVSCAPCDAEHLGQWLDSEGFRVKSRPMKNPQELGW